MTSTTAPPIAPPTPQPAARPEAPAPKRELGVMNAFSHGFLFIWGAMVTIPLVWAVIQSFKTDSEIIHSPLGLPEQWLFGAFGRAWTKGHIGEFFLNTVLVMAFSVTLTMLFGSMAAYVLARYKFPGNGVIYWTFVTGLTVPIYMGILPLYLLVKDIGELLGMESLIGVDTRGGLILVYIAYSMPFTIFFLHAFFRWWQTTPPSDF